MYTIYDYLNNYKNYDIKEKEWNMMDNLLCSILAYMPIKSFKNIRTFDSVCDEILEVKINKPNSMRSKVKELVSIIKESKRYKEMKLKNFINIVDDKTQFGALTCTIDNIKIISFKGTEGSVIGWLENFRLSYEYPTYTQSLAIKYLDNNINLLDNKVYVVGHSKGGNLAMSSSMELSNIKYNKIKQVINFDGPGFRKNEFKTKKYKRLSKKLINIIPKRSYVGVLMFNDNYNVIKTKSIGINEHFPTCWYIKDNSFINAKLSKLSLELLIRTSVDMTDDELNNVKKIFETSFDSIKDKTTTISLNDVINITKSVKNIDSKTGKYIHSIMKSMLKISTKERSKI